MRIKTTVLVLALLSLVGVTTSACAANPVQVTPESVNFGEVVQGETAIARFQLHNTGTQAVNIHWMEFSSPGLVAQVSPHIAAGSSVEVLVNWKTSGFSGGIEGQIALGLDDPQNPEVVLTVSGTVIPAEQNTPDTPTPQ